MAADPFRTVHRHLTAQEHQAIERIKGKAAALMQEMDKLPQTREVGLAKTRLEEAVMWACKAVSS